MPPPTTAEFAGRVLAVLASPDMEVSKVWRSKGRLCATVRKAATSQAPDHRPACSP